jgi:FMN-dependent NADH-azoreductase
MWNFGIPYRLKHFVDVITQPGLSFSYSPEEGYRGLVTGKPVAVVYARGGEYSSSAGAQAMDFQKPYLEALLKFLGFTTIETVLVEPTLAAPAEAAGAEERAVEQARKVAAGF